VVERRQCPIELLEMIGQRALGLNIERRAEPFHERLDSEPLAIQLTAGVVKIVHRALLSRKPGASVTERLSRNYSATILARARWYSAGVITSRW
jgi:hypothetical protein